MQICHMCLLQHYRYSKSPLCAYYNITDTLNLLYVLTTTLQIL
uniref:Uncharacterized protein n=1 Tax=Anguilla anguilla TaxID=7936 RepID=A0A0E9VWA6_ANGAN